MHNDVLRLTVAEIQMGPQKCVRSSSTQLSDKDSDTVKKTLQFFMNLCEIHDSAGSQGLAKGIHTKTK